jgi:hypothetical protein
MRRHTKHKCWHRSLLMPKVGVPRSSPAARKPTPAPAAREDPHPLSGWKARRLPHHKLYPPSSYVRDGDGHKVPSRGPRYPRVGLMLVRNWPLPGNGSCSEIRASTVSRATHRPHIGLYIAISPPLGHHHSFIYTPIYTYLSPQPLQALTYSKGVVQPRNQSRIGWVQKG